jgi:hypothetical protein
MTYTTMWVVIASLASAIIFFGFACYEGRWLLSTYIINRVYSTWGDTAWDIFRFVLYCVCSYTLWNVGIDILGGNF